MFNDNGAWSWFEDERAVVDEFGGVLLVSSVANGSGSGGAARHGNVEVTTFDLAETSTERTVLHANLEADDHDSAALLVRPDGRHLAMYSRHNTDGYSRWRIADEQRMGPGAHVRPRHSDDLLKRVPLGASRHRPALRLRAHPRA